MASPLDTTVVNISRWIDKHARFTPDKVAIRFEGQTISYRDLAQQIEQAAAMMQTKLGVEHGDRVSILSLNIPEYLITLFACARIGAIFNPLNWRLAVPELLYILEDAESSVLLIEDEFASVVTPAQQSLPHCQIVGFNFTPANGSRWKELLHESENVNTTVKISLDDPLLLVYTSGTTGHPKGALLTQSALFWNAINSQHMQDLTAADHVLTCLPLFHVGGLNNQTTPALHVGATVTLHRRFTPNDVLHTISKEGPTLTCLVPATMQACIASQQWAATDFSRLRANVTGSTIVPGHLSDQFRARGVAVLEMYGATETGPIALYHRPDSDFDKRGSTGLPGLHTEARVVDADGKPLVANEEGEILLRGPHIMREYWRDKAASKAALKDGWFHTGDIGSYDEDGYYTIKDRKKNMIISGGENIYAAEVELVLARHPGVIDCALIGVPDERWGESPVAVVVCQAGVDEAALHGFMDGKLARYKLPCAYYFVDELPKSALGKIQHFLVHQIVRTYFSAAQPD